MTLIVAKDIAWVRDRTMCILIERNSTLTWTFSDADALIWSLLMLGYRLGDIADALILACGLSPLEAENQLCSTLQAWVEEGILKDKIDHG